MTKAPYIAKEYLEDNNILSIYSLGGPIMNYNIFNKSELEYDYITCDLSREEMMKKYNINSLTSFKRIMSYFNIKKPTFNLQKKDLYQYQNILGIIINQKK